MNPYLDIISLKSKLLALKPGLAGCVQELFEGTPFNFLEDKELNVLMLFGAWDTLDNEQDPENVEIAKTIKEKIMAHLEAWSQDAQPYLQEFARHGYPHNSVCANLAQKIRDTANPTLSVSWEICTLVVKHASLLGEYYKCSGWCEIQMPCQKRTRP